MTNMLPFRVPTSKTQEIAKSARKHEAQHDEAVTLPEIFIYLPGTKKPTLRII